MDYFDLYTAGWLLAIYAAIAVLGLLYIFIVRFYVAYRMAKNRHRDPAGWVLLSLFFSPILAWILLFVMGDEQRPASAPANPSPASDNQVEDVEAEEVK